MIRVLHIITDTKFVNSHIDRFIHSEAENKYVFLSYEPQNYSGRYSDIIVRVKPFSREYFDLISEGGSFDIVIAYNLDYYKSYLINRFSPKPTVLLYFYGGLIYAKDFYIFERYSPMTLELINPRIFKLKDSLRELARNIWYRVRFKVKPMNFLKDKKAKKEYWECLNNKVDYFMWYNKYEYEFVREGKYLPPFLYIPLVANKYISLDIVNKTKTNKIIVGGSWSPKGNHPDVLQKLITTGFKGKVIVPFSYGEGKMLHYKKKIVDMVKKSKLDADILLKFLPYDVYTELISTADAIIVNSYIQMSLGNIFICLINGVKVYLSERNVTYPWLKDIGFQIFSIENNLEADLLSGNTFLRKDSMIHNRQVFNEEFHARHSDAFLKNIFEISQKASVAQSAIQ